MGYVVTDLTGTLTNNDKIPDNVKHLLPYVNNIVDESLHVLVNS